MRKAQRILAIKEREAISKDNDSLRRSSLQRSYEVKAMKDEHARTSGKRSDTDLIALYTSMELADSSEKVHTSFIEVSMMLHKSTLCSTDGAERTFQV